VLVPPCDDSSLAGAVVGGPPPVNQELEEVLLRCWAPPSGLRGLGHTCGPVGHSRNQIVIGTTRAHEGIARGSENGDRCAERKAQSGPNW
jgi:hypothetical protein